jgi:hypothetical protein
MEIRSRVETKKQEGVGYVAICYDSALDTGSKPEKEASK